MEEVENPRMRLEASVKNRIMTGYALCALAESHLHEGERERASNTVAAIRKRMADVTLLLGGGNLMGAIAIREATELLADLEDRVAKVEAAIG
jgi:hypothetical protein